MASAAAACVRSAEGSAAVRTADLTLAVAAGMTSAGFADEPSAAVAIAGSAAAVVELAGLLAEKPVDLAVVAALAVLPAEPFAGEAAAVPCH